MKDKFNKYIGFNVELIEKAEVKEAKFLTEYVYEVTFDSWGIELSSYQDQDTFEKSKGGLEKVCG